MSVWSGNVASRLLAGGVLLACCASLPAAAQTITAANPAGIADALQELGYRAQIETDDRGDPKVSSTMEGVNYEIHFYGCTEAMNCKYLNFSAGFNMANGLPMASVNEWNRGKLVGKVYVDDENDPYLQYFVTTDGGLSRQNFADVVDWWRVALEQFTDHIGW